MDLSEQSPCANATLRRATRRLGQLYDDMIGSAGLKATQFGLLYRIQYLAQPSLRTLATDLVMDISALGHTLKPLQRDGLVTLIPDPNDKRAKLVCLTPEGEEKVAAGIIEWEKAHRRFEALFGEEKAALLHEMLNTIASQQFADAFKTIPD